VEVINTFRQEHGLVPLAVCSRQADYEALAVKLQLRGALVLQPLTRLQIDRYLTRAGVALAGVGAALRQDETLWELLDTPLMLSIAVLAYGGHSAAEVQNTGTLEERKAHLFAAYTDAMFNRRGEAAPYSRPQTVQWLAWLAATMAGQNQSVFYLEGLQPNWLPGRMPQWMVTWGTGLLILLVFVLGGGVVFVLGGGLVILLGGWLILVSGGVVGLGGVTDSRVQLAGSVRILLSMDLNSKTKFITIHK
jgi:hypothetical protein